MKSNGANKILVATAVASFMGLSASNVLASDAAQIEAGASGTVTYDNASGAYPVVNAVLTAPGSLDGYTYKNYSFLAADSSGSLDMFYSSSAATYAPTVGDAVSVTGSYAPFDGVPEIDTPLSISQISSGNAYSGPALVTIPQVNVTSLNSPGLVNSPGMLVQIDNVTLGNAGSVWTSHANVTTTISDGVNSMVLYDWASSYSVDGALGGTVAPTGLVDVTGFVDFYAGSSEAEFIPVSISAVPEPAALPLCGAGLALVAGVFCSRSRKQA
jgi:hypothetical protein